MFFPPTFLFGCVFGRLRERRQREEAEARRQEEAERAARRRLKRLANASGNAREFLWNAQCALRETEDEMYERVRAAEQEVRVAESVLHETLGDEARAKARLARLIAQRRAPA